MSPLDYLFVESLNDTQIAAYESSKTDFIWSNTILKNIKSTTNYQLNVQIFIDDYIFMDSLMFNYSYDYSGVYMFSVQADNLNNSQSVTVYTGNGFFKYFNI